MDRRLENWCDQVISEVRSWVDHNAIRAELEAHIEDRCAALEELNYPPELAAERTLAAMGDPVAVGKALDKEHSLWLSRLWVASIVVMLFAWIWLYWDTYPRWGHYVERIQETVQPELYDNEDYIYMFNENFDVSTMHPEWEWVCTGAGSHEPVDIGDYTIEVHKAIWWRKFDKWTDIYILMSVTPQRFWYGGEIEFLGAIQAVDSTGAAIINDSIENNRILIGSTERPNMTLGEYGTQPFGSRKILISLNLLEDPDWVEFSYPYGDNDWVIRVEKEAAK